MCVQWLDIGVLVLKKPSHRILTIYCLNKALEAFIGLMFC
jgi:hypothetical protein